jgi:transitional endoplasmic reticulum ATPase
VAVVVAVVVVAAAVQEILRGLFRQARAMRPCVLFLDEIDAVVGRRALDGGGGDGEAAGVQQRVLSTLLNEMDGVDTGGGGGGGVVVVAATNRLDMIDAALLRPGRFDRLVEAPLPDAAGRAAILRAAVARRRAAASARGLPAAEDSEEVDLGWVAAAAEGLSGAEVAALCVEAALSALREDPEAAASVCGRHWHSALGRVRPRSAAQGQQ